MSETKKIPKRTQDILDGLEFRTGKRKVQTKEDLKNASGKNALMLILQKKMENRGCIAEMT